MITDKHSSFATQPETFHTFECDECHKQAKEDSKWAYRRYSANYSKICEECMEDRL